MNHFLCVQVVFVRIDEFDDLQEPPTIDESAISIVQVIAFFGTFNTQGRDPEHTMGLHSNVLLSLFR